MTRQISPRPLLPFLPLTFSLSLVASVFLFALCAFCFTTDGPRLQMQGEVDFGNVGQDDTRSKQVRFTNTGNEPLTISGIKSNSSYVTARNNNGPIGPGKSGVITVNFKPTKRTSEGNFETTLIISSNGGAQNIAVGAYVIAGPSISGGQQTTPKSNIADPTSSKRVKMPPNKAAALDTHRKKSSNNKRN